MTLRAARICSVRYDCAAVLTTALLHCLCVRSPCALGWFAGVGASWCRVVWCVALCLIVCCLCWIVLCCVVWCWCGVVSCCVVLRCVVHNLNQCCSYLFLCMLISTILCILDNFHHSVRRPTPPIAIIHKHTCSKTESNMSFWTSSVCFHSVLEAYEWCRRSK